MIVEVARHKCVSNDGYPLVVIRYRHVFSATGAGATRQYRGAAWLTLLDGEPVRYVDPGTFELVATGEFITHDRARCDCLPATKVTTSGELDRR